MSSSRSSRSQNKKGTGLQGFLDMGSQYIDPKSIASVPLLRSPPAPGNQLHFIVSSKTRRITIGDYKENMRL